MAESIGIGLMAALSNLDHERFCEALRTRLVSGEKVAAARVGAYRDAIYRGKSVNDVTLAPNARRLANRVDVKLRLTEMADREALIAGIDRGWALLKLKKLTDSIEGFNLHDFLSAPDAEGNRYFDLAKVPADKMALLNELSIDEETEIDGEPLILEGGETRQATRRIRKIRLKGPAKVDMVGPLTLLMRLEGWEAPKKIAPTDKDGNNLSLADLVEASMALVLERRAAAPKPPAAG